MTTPRREEGYRLKGIFNRTLRPAWVVFSEDGNADDGDTDDGVLMKKKTLVCILH